MFTTQSTSSSVNSLSMNFIIIGNEEENHNTGNDDADGNVLDAFSFALLHFTD